MPKRQRPSDASGPPETSKQFLAVLTGIEEHMDRILEPVHDDVQAIFERLVGDFGSYEASRQVVSRLQHLLSRLRLGLECQYQGCGKPGRLRCKPGPTVQPWRFVFAHP